MPTGRRALAAAAGHDGTAEALADADWFSEHPDRRYRTRPAADGGIWLVRRRGRVLLRTRTGTGTREPTSEAEIEAAW